MHVLKGGPEGGWGGGLAVHGTIFTGAPKLSFLLTVSTIQIYFENMFLKNFDYE